MIPLTPTMARLKHMILEENDPADIDMLILHCYAEGANASLRQAIYGEPMPELTLPEGYPAPQRESLNVTA